MAANAARFLTAMFKPLAHQRRNIGRRAKGFQGQFNRPARPVWAYIQSFQCGNGIACGLAL
jgi:hypothetical protein